MKTPKDIVRDDIEEIENWIYDVVKMYTVDARNRNEDNVHINLMHCMFKGYNRQDLVLRYFREYDGWNRLTAAGYKVACVRIPYGLSLTDSSRKVYYEDSITVRFDIPKVEPIANNPKTNISDEVIASMKRMDSPWHHW